MIKRLSFMFLIVVIGINLQVICLDSQNAITEQQINNDINYKKREIKQLYADLKSLKRNNKPKKEIEALQANIKTKEKDLKVLKKEQRTSNTFFKRKSDIEARTTFDVNHGQDIYAPNYFQQKEPSYDNQLGGYFRNH